MSDRVPRIGDVVLYELSDHDAALVNIRRRDATTHLREHTEAATGVQLHTGNRVAEGSVYPMTITHVWGDRPDAGVNGTVHLDGTDTLWATSVSHGTGARHFVYRD